MFQEAVFTVKVYIQKTHLLFFFLEQNFAHWQRIFIVEAITVKKVSKPSHLFYICLAC